MKGSEPGRECHQQSYPARNPVRFNTDWNDKLYLGINVLWIARHFIIVFKAHSTRQNPHNMFKDNLVCLWHGIWVAWAAAHYYPQTITTCHSPKGQQEGRASIHLCHVPLDLKAVFAVGASRRRIKRCRGVFLSQWASLVESSGWGFLKLNLASLAYTYLLLGSPHTVLGEQLTCRSSQRMSQVPLHHQACLLGAHGCLYVNTRTHAHMCMWTQHTHSSFPCCFRRRDRMLKPVLACCACVSRCCFPVEPGRMWTSYQEDNNLLALLEESQPKALALS